MCAASSSVAQFGKWAYSGAGLSWGGPGWRLAEPRVKPKDSALLNPCALLSRSAEEGGQGPKVGALATSLFFLSSSHMRLVCQCPLLCSRLKTRFRAACRFQLSDAMGPAFAVQAPCVIQLTVKALPVFSAENLYPSS